MADQEREPLEYSWGTVSLPFLRAVWPFGEESLEHLIRGIARSAGEELTKRAEDRTPVFLSLISRARDYVYTVSGQLHPKFWEQPPVLQALRGRLAEGVRVHLLFGKPGITSPEEAENVVRRVNPGIIDLKLQYSNQLRLFWVDERPRIHFTVVDGMHIMHEEICSSGITPATITRFKDRKWASPWSERFVNITVRDKLSRELFA